MASEYAPFCPRYCHRPVLGIRSANKYYIQACVLGKEGGAGNEDTKLYSYQQENTETRIFIAHRSHRSHRNSLIYLFNTLKINAHRSSSHRLIINRKHGDTEGLEILEIRYLWNNANSFVFFLREVIKGQGPRVHRTIKSLRRKFRSISFNLLIAFLSTRENGDTEGLDFEVCCSADKSECICFSLKNSILETDVSATDVAGI